MKESTYYKFLIDVKASYLVIGFVIFVLVNCKTVPVKREIKKVQEIATISPSHKFIKAHMQNGAVYILHKWHFDKDNNSLNGYGTWLGINRNIIEERGNHESKSKNNEEPFKIGIADISLLETNDPGPSLAGGLAVVTGITAGFTIFCLVNPKACFGSCPTFYAYDGDTLSLQAEGFSASISPSLEKRDIDMLYTAQPEKDFELIVTNEALETHSIRYANLLVFEKKGDERIFVSPEGTFYKSKGIIQPTACQDKNGECLSKVVDVDGDELFSVAGSQEP